MAFTTFVVGLITIVVVSSSRHQFPGDVDVEIQSMSSVALPSSCAALEDGDHWMKLIDSDDYPPVYASCRNGYMIIDVLKDDNLKSYFSDWYLWHYALAGPDIETGVNWESWWLPNAKYKTQPGVAVEDSDSKPRFHYLISPDCASCDESSELQDHATQTSYYMTGTIFLCLTHHKAMRDCAWDWDSYTCNHCTLMKPYGDLHYSLFTDKDTDKDKREAAFLKHKSETSTGDAFRWYQMGLCGFATDESNSDNVPQSRTDCLSVSSNSVQPSVGIDGRFCQCVKPARRETYLVPAQTLAMYQAKQKRGDKEAQEAEAEEEMGSVSSVDDVYKLYQSDFEAGTYRITKAGTYLIMEDIEFDFGAPRDDPLWLRSNEGFAWWPRPDQQERYPGAYQTRDEYFMGFFAGITVETDHVVIDLQGHELRQSLAFYYQQRYFFVISLKSVMFNLNNGPGMFGAQPAFSSHVVIRNGVIGLSSHMGIHGHRNSHVLIENLQVRDFETHGIEMTDFKQIAIRNVEIGPSTQRAFLKGEYAYARLTLQKLERIRDTPSKYDASQFPLRFSGRDDRYQLRDLIDRLRTRMDMAFKFAMGLKSESEYRAEDEEDYATWLEAKRLFINEDGIPSGAAMYGLFLNLYVSNVFGIHPSMKHSQQATVENVKIHDLVHRMQEYVREDDYFQERYKNPYSASFDAMALFGEEVVMQGADIDWSTVTYKGDALTDAHIALNCITASWSEKAQLYVSDKFERWAFGEDSFSNPDPAVGEEETHPLLGCNNDRMSHLPKGTVGIRIDGAHQVVFKSIEVANLHELSPLGYDVCGDYWDGNYHSFTGGGHFMSQVPYTYGYSGNMVHGVFADWADVEFEDVSISELYSATGVVNGIGAYTSMQMTFKGKIEVHDLYAGYQLHDDGVDTDALQHPYNPAIAMPAYVLGDYEYSMDNGDGWKSFSTLLMSSVDTSAVDNQITVYCVDGVDGTGNDFDSEVVRVNRNAECSRGRFHKSRAQGSSSLVASRKFLIGEIIALCVLVLAVSIIVIGVCARGYVATKIRGAVFSDYHLYSEL